MIYRSRNTAYKNILKSFLIMLPGLVASCGSEPDIVAYSAPSYYLHIKHFAGIEFEDASIKVKLYGIHRSIQDVSATLISENVLVIEKVPAYINLPWPENAYQLIDNPPVSTQADAKYYLTISIDANNDGVLCNVDYQQDYDKTPFFTMKAIPFEVIEIHVESIDREGCIMF